MKRERVSKIAVNFLRDDWPNLICFLLGFALTAAFYCMLTKYWLEVVYPFCLLAFVLIIRTIYYFMRYLRLYRAIESMEQYDDIAITLSGRMETHIMEQMWKIHRTHMNQTESYRQSNQKKMRFLSMLIHNMKTPISVNDLLLQRIQSGEVETTEGLKQFKEENDRLLVQLDNTLQIFRLEEFQKDYIPEPLDLLGELRRIINQNKKQFIYHKVFPKIESELKEAVVLSDRRWNQLMIEQLISNGIKYSSCQETKYLHFMVSQTGKYIQLRIRDEGIGIPEYDLGKVFEPFFTGENGRQGYSSSGIGLYFCQEVSECLGHGLKIESTEGEGTIVTITYLAKL